MNNEYPIHVVCKWLDNTPKVAQKHYLQVTDQHCSSATESKVAQSEKKVAQKVAQQIDELGCQSMSPQFGSAENVGIYGTEENKEYPVQDSNLEPSD